MLLFRVQFPVSPAIILANICIIIIKSKHPYNILANVQKRVQFNGKTVNFKFIISCSSRDTLVLVKGTSNRYLHNYNGEGDLFNRKLPLFKYSIKIKRLIIS